MASVLSRCLVLGMCRIVSVSRERCDDLGYESAIGDQIIIAVYGAFSVVKVTALESLRR